MSAVTGTLLVAGALAYGWGTGRLLLGGRLQDNVVTAIAGAVCISVAIALMWVWP